MHQGSKQISLKFVRKGAANTWLVCAATNLGGFGPPPKKGGGARIVWNCGRTLSESVLPPVAAAFSAVQAVGFYLSGFLNDLVAFCHNLLLKERFPPPSSSTPLFFLFIKELSARCQALASGNRYVKKRSNPRKQRVPDYCLKSDARRENSVNVC